MPSNLAISMNDTRDALHVDEVQGHLHMGVVQHRKKTGEGVRVHLAVSVQSFLNILVQEARDRVHRHQAVHEAAGREFVQWHREQIVLDLLKEATVKRPGPSANLMDGLAIPVEPADDEQNLDDSFLGNGGYCDGEPESLFGSLELLKAMSIVELAISLDGGDHARRYNCGDRSDSLNPGRPIESIGRYEYARDYKNCDRPSTQGVQHPEATNVAWPIFHREILA